MDLDQLPVRPVDSDDTQSFLRFDLEYGVWEGDYETRECTTSEDQLQGINQRLKEGLGEHLFNGYANQLREFLLYTDIAKLRDKFLIDPYLHKALTFSAPFNEDSVLRQVLENYFDENFKKDVAETYGEDFEIDDELFKDSVKALIDLLMVIAKRGEILAVQAKMASLLTPAEGDLPALPTDLEKLSGVAAQVERILSLAVVDVDGVVKPHKPSAEQGSIPGRFSVAVEMLDVLQGGRGPEGDES